MRNKEIIFFEENSVTSLVNLNKETIIKEEPIIGRNETFRRANGRELIDNINFLPAGNLRKKSATPVVKPRKHGRSRSTASLENALSIFTFLFFLRFMASIHSFSRSTKCKKIVWAFYVIFEKNNTSTKG